MKYKDRRTATAFLRDQGVVLGDQTLQDLAHQERGPKYAVINGRALYLEAHLLAWIRGEADTERPRKRSRRTDRATAL